VKILLISDIHGKWSILYEILEKERPDLLLSGGDWGTDSKGNDLMFKQFIKDAKIPIITVYGNHDSIELIKNLKEKNFYWLPTFIPRTIKGLTFLGINGNIAGKRRRFPWHTTESIIREELRIYKLSRPRKINFLVFHETVKGFSDVIKMKEGKKHVGWESLLEVVDQIRPRFVLTGHIHFQQASKFRDIVIFNTGYGLKGDYIILKEDKEWEMKTLRGEGFGGS